MQSNQESTQQPRGPQAAGASSSQKPQPWDGFETDRSWRGDGVEALPAQNSPATATVDAPGSGGSVYLEFIKEQQDTEDDRQKSLEQRGIAVITTSGALVTLLFGLATFVTEKQAFTLPSGARTLLFVALAFFFAAAVAAIGTNAPLPYRGVRAAGLLSSVKDNWSDSEGDAKQRIAATRLRIYAEAKRLNNLKAMILLAAISAEVLAVLFVALAVGVVLRGV